MATPKPSQPSPADPAILNNALRALSLDIDAAISAAQNIEPTKQQQAHHGGDLVSPLFEAPTPLSTPILPSFESSPAPALPLATLARTQSISATQAGEWTATEMGPVRRASVTFSNSDKDSPNTSARTTSTLVDSSDQATPPATPRPALTSSGFQQAAAAPGLQGGSTASTSTAGPLTASAVPTTNKQAVSAHAREEVETTKEPAITMRTPTVRVRPAAGDALEIATRLQQQQIQAQRTNHLMDSIRTPVTQLNSGLDQQESSKLGSNALAPVLPTNGSVTDLRVGQSATPTSQQSTVLPYGLHSVPQTALLAGNMVSASLGSGAALGSAFVSPPPAQGEPAPLGSTSLSQLTDRAVVGNTAAMSGLSTFPLGLGAHPTPPTPANTGATTPAAGLSAFSAAFDMGISPTLDPTTMLFHNEHTANVYVNALPLTTTDDDLYRIGSAFGTVLSHKAIIAAETGLCKGYGFLLYTSREEAERAIGCLSRMGLQASFAKESFSARLRRMADKGSSNVYLSNLPTDMTTHQLEHLFAPHNVVSMRILLNSDGTSRGVGFVRLRDREVAQDCIDRLHGKMLPGSASPLQVRFADSEGQKLLKRNAMMQNSINALNAQARDVLRSSGGQLLGTTSSLLGDVGIPSPSASPHAHFPMPVTSIGALSAGTQASMYMPYSSTPPTSAAAALQARPQVGQLPPHLLNPASQLIGASATTAMPGLNAVSGLPTPGPSPRDVDVAAMGALLATSSQGPVQPSVTSLAAPYNVGFSPLGAMTPGGLVSSGPVSVTAAMHSGLAGGMAVGRMGLASPIPTSLALSRPPMVSSAQVANTSAGSTTANSSSAASSASATGLTVPSFATPAGMAFSPPMLHINLGGADASYHAQPYLSAPPPSSSTAATQISTGGVAAAPTGSSLLDSQLRSTINATATSGSSGITAPYSSFQLQQMLGSSSATSTSDAAASSRQPTGLVSSFEDGSHARHVSDGSSNSGPAKEDGQTRVGAA